MAKTSVLHVSTRTIAAQDQQLTGVTDRTATRGLSIVYYLRLPDGLIKIGTTSRPLDRIGEHRRKSGSVEVLAIEFGDDQLERMRHNQFRSWRVGRAEHFEPSTELQAHIDGLRAELGICF